MYVTGRIVGYRYFPQMEANRGNALLERQLDWKGMVLLMIGVTLIVSGLSFIGTQGATSILVGAVLTIIGTSLMGVFLFLRLRDIL